MPVRLNLGFVATVGASERFYNKENSSPHNKSCLGSENLIEVQKKIKNLDQQGEQDLETSLALAAEAGSFLIQENDELKQDENARLLTVVCRFKTALQNSEDLEDVLRLSEETVYTQQDRIQELQLEVQHLNRKLNQEISLKEEIIHQAESYKLISNSTLRDIKRELKEKSLKSENDITSLKSKIENLFSIEENLKREMEDKDNYLMTLRADYDLVSIKLKNQEEKIKSCISIFLNNVKSNLSPDILLHSTSVHSNSTNEQLIDGVEENITLCMSLVHTTKKSTDILTGEIKKLNQAVNRRDSQTPPKKLNLIMTGRDSQTPSKQTEPDYNWERQPNSL
ncbi:hypothetical protein J6590_033159 [Homalodisca vitripennis]|nr:hypothetical protein J6590_033159 [Homalodisca vitripennis]